MQQQAPQQAPILKYKKSNDFDGVLEEAYHPTMKEPDGTPKYLGVKCWTRSELENVKKQMMQKHAQELNAVNKVFAVLNMKKKAAKKVPKKKRG